MLKIGTDIVEISRISTMKNLDTFIKRIFTKREAEYFSERKNPHQSIAGAFAAKEAFAKYTGSGFRGFGFSDIEVLHDELGKPYLCFMGKKINADVSISHTDTTATAVVCGEDFVFSGERFELWKSYRALLPKRRPDVHKGDCGRVFIIAGSVGMVGAGCLCSLSALRCGSGLVTLGLPECIQPQGAIKVTEAMTLPLDCRNGFLSASAITKIKEKLSSCDVCAVGPGLGVTKDVLAVVEAVLGEEKPCVIDADALNALSVDMSILKRKKCMAVLTPHPGEMSRLTGKTIEEIESDRAGAAQDLAKNYNCVVVLKGHESVIASPKGELHINNSGNSGMASGGMGDVLTGVIASFIGQGMSPYDAAVLGVFLHGLAGDLAAEEKGEFGLIAGDVAEKLPYAIKGLKDGIL